MDTVAARNQAVVPTLRQVPRLIVLNGAPGVGKSTVAQRYVDEHPFALDLEPERLRRQLGRWAVHADAARMLERSGGVRQLEAMYDRLLLVVAARPGAVVVAARTGAIDETYAAVCAALTGQGR